MPCASTGIAAELLIEGTTAHRRFRIRNNIDNKTEIYVDQESHFARVMRAADVIIIDEVSMQHKFVLMYINRLLNEICAVENRIRVHKRYFGGKVHINYKNLYSLLFIRLLYLVVIGSSLCQSLSMQVHTRMKPNT